MYKVFGGILSVVTGTGTSTYLGENIAITSSAVSAPVGVDVDSSNGDMYVASTNVHRVLVLTKTTGLSSTIAGTGASGSAGDGGAATAATLNVPAGIVLKGSGPQVYICEYAGNKIRLVFSIMPTAAPSIVPTISHSRIPTIVPSTSPTQPTVQPTTVSPTTVRSTSNYVYNIAGTGTASSTGTGGKATAATFNNPTIVWGDSLGFVYIQEAGGCCIRKFSNGDSIVVSFAGVCNSCGSLSGTKPATSAQVSYPFGMAISTSGVIYIASAGARQLVAVSISNVASVAAGTGSCSPSCNSGDDGQATAAGFNNVGGVWIDTVGKIYVPVYFVYAIRVISTMGIVTVYAGLRLHALLC